jgi:hypothetical protein
MIAAILIAFSIIVSQVIVVLLIVHKIEVAYFRITGHRWSDWELLCETSIVPPSCPGTSLGLDETTNHLRSDRSETVLH